MQRSGENAHIALNFLHCIKKNLPMRALRIIVAILIVVILIQFLNNSKRKVYICIQNSSPSHNNVEFLVAIDDSIVIKDNFLYEPIFNLCKSYLFSFDKGYHKIKVILPKENMAKEVRFQLKNETYVNIDYQFKILSREALNDDLKLLRSRGITAEMIDTILEEKNINIGITDERVVSY